LRTDEGEAMKWTTKPPTVAGWYWLHRELAGDEIVHVAGDPLAACLMQCRVTVPLSDHFAGALWCGPLAPPPQPELRACAVCQRPIKIGPGNFTKARELCSPACKQRGHRNKVKRAKELHEQNWTAKKIAKELGTEPGAVTNWLNKKK